MRYQMNKTVPLGLVVSFAILICLASAQAADADGYALLVQQSPPDGGSVTPGSGVHKMVIGETVSLSAIPKPGYRFLYWLGDVSSTGTSDTSIQIDSPKMVVAVFAREDHEEGLPGIRQVEGSIGGGGGGRGGANNPIFNTGGANPGAYTYYNPGDFIYNFPDPITDTQEDSLKEKAPLVPGVNVQNTPEPATILMMGLGATALLKRKRK